MKIADRETIGAVREMSCEAQSASTICPRRTRNRKGRLRAFPSGRIESRNTHGTGCVLAAAITARLARGEGLRDAIKGAKAFVTLAIRTSPGLGTGFGPTNLHAEVSVENNEDNPL